MPNMFSRRRGSSAHRPVDANTSAAAATAASSAFLHRNSSQASLSSAAAAAALRSQTTSPEPVGNIQTKRMVRRGSQTSIASGSVIGSATRGGVGRGGLQRNNSSGSMTDRTFRSPSPGRGSSMSMSADADAPPVPSIPTDVRGAHQRSASQEPVRRVISPSPRGNRGVSVDRATATPTSARSSKRLSNVPESIVEDGSPSVNFSRPISSPGPSPIATSKTHSSGSWFTGASGSQQMSDVKPATRPATSSGVPSHEISGTQQGLNAAANGPVKKRQSHHNAQGSHLARSQTPTSVVTDSSDTVMVYDPNSRKFVARPRTQAETIEPSSPVLPQAPAPAPGTYDPNTRKIVPIAPADTSASASGSDVAVRKTRQSLPPVETALEPPPRNPARMSPQSSPTTTRSSGLQHQPSVVREDPEAEKAEEAASGSNQQKAAPQHQRIASMPAKAYATQTSKPRSGSLDVPRSISSDRGRGGSLSPSRSARFSAAPIIEGIKHEPHRGVSPVKSAMKNSASPASSVRTSSPMTNASPTGARAPSETSEAPSLEGQPKKKKSVRVSFDASPQEIQAPSTPATSSTITRERSPVIDDDMDEIMKPRPALPSFGSVRRDRVQQDYAEKVTENPPDRHEPSSDHAIGGILSNSNAPTQSSNDPLPPEVTSKDGPSYISDESEDENFAAIKPQTVEVPPAQPVTPAVDDAASAGHNNAIAELEAVPQIGVQPPTPGEEQNKKLGDATPPASPKPKQEFQVPGGWGQDEEPESQPVAPTAQTEFVEPKTIGTFSQPAAVAESPVPTMSGPIAKPAANDALNLSDITETDSDDSAAFSDAAEDLSDLDEGGFASLDAIVESPAVPPSSTATKKSVTTPPDSPSARQAAKQHTRGGVNDSSGDWSQATAYWSRLSRQQREQIEREHLSSDDEYRPQPTMAQKPRKKKSALKQSAAQAQPSQQTAVRAQPPAKQDTAPTIMRKSMRAQAGPAPATNEGVQMRSSLREGGGGSMRTSMRGPPAQRPQSELINARGPAQRQNARPMSAIDTASSNAAAGGAMLNYQSSPKEISQDSPFPRLGPKQAANPPPQSSRLSKQQKQQPIIADESDSESSFKKKRRPSASTVDASGRYSMKRSMRAGSIDSEQARPISPTPEKRKAFSVRSLSPTGSFFGRNRQNLKESMRAPPPPANSGGKTLRGPNSIKGGSNKTMRNAAPARPATSSGAMTSRFKSKFADSDDEDDGGRGGGRSFFRSKFADSDDDEPGSPGFIAADLTPVRGIPRRKGQEDGDSTDLSDEEDEDPRKASRRRTKPNAPIVPDPADVEKAMEAARRNLGMTNGTTTAANTQPKQGGGNALSKGSLRQSQQPSATQQTAPAPDVTETPKRRGFMGSILRRNKASTSSVAQIAPNSPATPATASVPGTASPRLSTAVPARPMSPPASPSRGKLVRRGTAQSRLSRADSNLSTTAAPTDVPPLPTQQKNESDNWPLSPPPKVTANGVQTSPPGQADDRPNTSDGIHEQAVKLARTMRPDMASRSNSARDFGPKPARGGHVGFAPDAKMEDGEGGKVYSAKTGKKKKFGMLRKAFGLND